MTRCRELGAYDQVAGTIATRKQLKSIVGTLTSNTSLTLVARGVGVSFPMPGTIFLAVIMEKAGNTARKESNNGR